MEITLKDGKIDQISRPYGKFAAYYKDGSFKNEDGIYAGNEVVKWYKLENKIKSN